MVHSSPSSATQNDDFPSDSCYGETHHGCSTSCSLPKWDTGRFPLQVGTRHHPHAIPCIDRPLELWIPVLTDTLTSPLNQNIFYRSHLFVYCYSAPALIPFHVPHSDVWPILAFLIDSVVLVLTIWGLYHRELRPPNRLWQMLYRQGIMYFVATIFVNVPLVVSPGCLGVSYRP